MNSSKKEAAFILYDALLSLIVLSGFIFFFTQVIVIVQNEEIGSSNQIQAINDVRGEYYAQEKSNEICQSYQNIDQKSKEVCFE